MLDLPQILGVTLVVGLKLATPKHHLLPDTHQFPFIPLDLKLFDTVTSLHVCMWQTQYDTLPGQGKHEVTAITKVGCESLLPSVEQDHFSSFSSSTHHCKKYLPV